MPSTSSPTGRCNNESGHFGPREWKALGEESRADPLARSLDDVLKQLSRTQRNKPLLFWVSVKHLCPNQYKWSHSFLKVHCFVVLYTSFCDLKNTVSVFSFSDCPAESGINPLPKIDLHLGTDDGTPPKDMARFITHIMGFFWREENRCKSVQVAVGRLFGWF